MASGKIQYKDLGLILTLCIIYPLLLTLAGYVTVGPDYQFNLTDLSKNLFFTVIGVGLLRSIIVILDIRLPWEGGVTKRFIIQWLIVLSIYILLQYFIFQMIVGDQANLTPITQIITYSIGITTVSIINSAYLYLYIRNVKEAHQNGAENKSNTELLLGKIGNKKIQIPIHESLVFFLADGVTRCIDRQNRQIIMMERLTDIESYVDQKEFFRANRQFIINRKAIKEIVYNTNKSSSVSLKTGHELIVSRHKAPQFKKWLKA